MSSPNNNSNSINGSNDSNNDVFINPAQFTRSLPTLPVPSVNIPHLTIHSLNRKRDNSTPVSYNTNSNNDSNNSNARRPSPIQSTGSAAESRGTPKHNNAISSNISSNSSLSMSGGKKRVTFALGESNINNTNNNNTNNNNSNRNNNRSNHNNDQYIPVAASGQGQLYMPGGASSQIEADDAVGFAYYNTRAVSRESSAGASRHAYSAGTGGAGVSGEGQGGRGRDADAYGSPFSTAVTIEAEGEPAGDQSGRNTFFSRYTRPMVPTSLLVNASRSMAWRHMICYYASHFACLLYAFFIRKLILTPLAMLYLFLRRGCRGAKGAADCTTLPSTSLNYFGGGRSRRRWTIPLAVLLFFIFILLINFLLIRGVLNKQRVQHSRSILIDAAIHREDGPQGDAQRQKHADSVIHNDLPGAGANSTRRGEQGQEKKSNDPQKSHNNNNNKDNDNKDKNNNDNHVEPKKSLPPSLAGYHVLAAAAAPGDGPLAGPYGGIGTPVALLGAGSFYPGTNLSSLDAPRVLAGAHGVPLLLPHYAPDVSAWSALSLSHLLRTPTPSGRGDGPAGKGKINLAASPDSWGPPVDGESEMLLLMGRITPSSLRGGGGGGSNPNIHGDKQSVGKNDDERRSSDDIIVDDIFSKADYAEALAARCAFLHGEPLLRPLSAGGQKESATPSSWPHLLTLRAQRHKKALAALRDAYDRANAGSSPATQNSSEVEHQMDLVGRRPHQEIMSQAIRAVAERAQLKNSRKKGAKRLPGTESPGGRLVLEDLIAEHTLFFNATGCDMLTVPFNPAHDARCIRYMTDMKNWASLQPLAMEYDQRTIKYEVLFKPVMVTDVPAAGAASPPQRPSRLPLKVIIKVPQRLFPYEAFSEVATFVADRLIAVHRTPPTGWTCVPVLVLRDALYLFQRRSRAPHGASAPGVVKEFLQDSGVSNYQQWLDKDLFAFTRSMRWQSLMSAEQQVAAQRWRVERFARARDAAQEEDRDAIPLSPLERYPDADPGYPEEQYCIPLSLQLKIVGVTHLLDSVLTIPYKSHNTSWHYYFNLRDQAAKAGFYNPSGGATTTPFIVDPIKSNAHLRELLEENQGRPDPGGYHYHYRHAPHVASLVHIAELALFDYVIGNDDRSPNKNNFVVGGCRYSSLACADLPIEHFSNHEIALPDATVASEGDAGLAPDMVLQHPGVPTPVYLDNGMGFYGSPTRNVIYKSVKALRTAARGAAPDGEASGYDYLRRTPIFCLFRAPQLSRIRELAQPASLTEAEPGKRRSAHDDGYDIGDQLEELNREEEEDAEFHKSKERHADRASRGAGKGTLNSKRKGGKQSADKTYFQARMEALLPPLISKYIGAQTLAGCARRLNDVLQLADRCLADPVISRYVLTP